MRPPSNRPRPAPTVKPFLRFVALSGGGWLLDCGLLLAITHLGMPLGGANFISSATAALTVFLVSRFLVFAPTSDAVWSRAALYLGYQTIGILAASMLIGPASAWAAGIAEWAGHPLSTQLASFFGKVFITPPQLVANFLVSRYLIQHFQRPIHHA